MPALAPPDQAVSLGTRPTGLAAIAGTLAEWITIGLQREAR